MSLKLCWTPTGGHTCSQGSLYHHLYHNQETSPAPYQAVLLAWQVVLASLTLSQYYRQGGKDNIRFPPWHSHSVLGYGHLCVLMFLQIFTSTLQQLWTTEEHILHMLHLNISDWLEGFAKILVKGDSVAHTGNGARAAPLLHIQTLGFCVSSSSSLTSNIQTKQVPNTTFKEEDLSKHLPGRWRSTPPI